MNFDISIGNLINIFMIAAGVGITLLCLLQISRAPFDKQVRKYFIVFLSFVLAYILMHLTRQMMDGVAGEGVRISLYIVTFIEFTVSCLMSIMLSQMILYIAAPKKEVTIISIVFFVLLGLHVALLIASQFTDMFYIFDENNVYHRGPVYIVSNLAPICMLLIDVYLLIRYRKKFDKRPLIAFWVYIIAPLIAIGLQTAYQEVQFVIFATVGAAINMFGVITRDLTERYEQQLTAASRIDAELSMATRIQSDMLPNIFPAFPERKDFDIYASMTPAKEVGGDFYDFFFIDEDTLGIVMADVSGKGVPAALFMMASKILVQNYTIMHKDPKAALEATNNQICMSNREQMFVTVWLGVLNLKTGVLTASNAGHEYPIIKNPNGKFEIFKDKHGLVIGAMEGAKYREYEVKLEKGSMLFIYTDGAPEATNADEQLFGTERLLATLNSQDFSTPKEVLDGVDKAVKDFVLDAPQFDDLTMLCLKYNGQ